MDEYRLDCSDCGATVFVKFPDWNSSYEIACCPCCGSDDYELEKIEEH